MSVNKANRMNNGDVHVSRKRLAVRFPAVKSPLYLLWRELDTKVLDTYAAYSLYFKKWFTF